MSRFDPYWDRYEKRNAEVCSPDVPPPTHMLVVDFEGNRPSRLEPTIYHRNFYLDDRCDKPECPRFRKDVE